MPVVPPKVEAVVFDPPIPPSMSSDDAVAAPPPEKELTKAERIYAQAVKEERFLLWLGEVPCFSCSSWPTRATFSITISGPWHNGRHITYATLPTPTQFEVETALAQAKAAWAAEKGVSIALPKELTPPPARRADGNAASGQRLFPNRPRLFPGLFE